MMRPIRFLILTDHRQHSDQNSLYSLTRTLRGDHRTASVFVASRGDERNTGFFAGDLNAKLFGIEAGPDFAFDPSLQQFAASSLSTSYGKAEVVWLRLPPPANRHFFAQLTAFVPSSTQLGKPIVINAPAGILQTGNKAFLLNFPDYTAPVLRVGSRADVLGMVAKYPIVLKPLQEYGGRGLVRILDGRVEVDGRQFELKEWLDDAESDIAEGNYLAMKYLKNVSEGDKRILVVNGKIMGASLRVPAAGEWLCNVSQGGTSVSGEVTPEERAMIAAVAPVLLEKGIVIFGADTLTDDDGKRVLSELNTNSIGGFPQAEAQTGRPILKETINEIYNYLYARL